MGIASAKRFYPVPSIYVLSKDIKNIKILLTKFSIFTDETDSMYIYITWACFRNDSLIHTKQGACYMYICLLKTRSYEPPRGKINNVVSEQV